MMPAAPFLIIDQKMIELHIESLLRRIKRDSICSSIICDLWEDRSSAYPHPGKDGDKHDTTPRLTHLFVRGSRLWRQDRRVL